MSQRSGVRGGRGGGRGNGLPNKRRVLEDESSSDASMSEDESSESSDYSSSEDTRPKKRAATRKPTTSTTSTTSTSQSSTPAKKGAAAPQVQAQKLSSEELTKLVDEFVRYVLFFDRKRVTITRADIVSKVLPNYKDRKIVTTVFSRGKAKLKGIFGYDFIEVKKDLGTSNDKANSTNFLIKNTLPIELINEIKSIDSVKFREDEDNNNYQALLIIILAIILLENGKFIESDVLFEKIRPLGFEQGTVHSVFGEWEKLFERYVRELYLTRKKGDRDGKIIHIYRFGPRSLSETTKKKVLRIISDMYGVEGEIDPILLKSIEMEEDDDEEKEDKNLEEESDSDDEILSATPIRRNQPPPSQHHKQTPQHKPAPIPTRSSQQQQRPSQQPQQRLSQQPTQQPLTRRR